MRTVTKQEAAPRALRPRPRLLRKSLGGHVFDTINALFMAAVCLSVLFPLWNMVVVSFSRIEDVSFMNLNLWPPHPVLDSYKYVLTETGFTNALLVSVARTVVGTAYHVLVVSMAAYALTRRRMPFLKFFTVLFIIPMFFSGGLIPSYINIRNLNLLNSFFVYVVPGAFSMYTVIIVRNFFFSIDPALEEAATIDGATPMQVLLRIILPLSKPVLATISLWQMVGQWNAWFDNLIYCSSKTLLTLQLLLRRMITEPEEFAQGAQQFALLEQFSVSLNPETIKATTTVLVILPILCVYPFLQKYFVQGIMLGSVKG